ncbi:MAG TPA: DEAD/DEAH box helicase [Desulfoprunum sp.]|nr:DEAD/DEAH box helicase [Desulfoprunum sp.]
MPKETELLDQATRLSPFEQSLLHLLSIIYEPAHTTLLVNCLRKLELHNPRGNRPTPVNLNHYLAKFEQLGFLTADHRLVPELVEIIARKTLADGNFGRYAAIIREEAPASYYYGKWSTRCWRAMRELRIGIYSQDFDLIEEAASFISSQCRDLVCSSPPIVQVVTEPFDPDWFAGLPLSFRFYLLNAVFRHGQTALTGFPQIQAYLETEHQSPALSPDEQLPFKRLLFNQYLLQGDFDQADLLLQTSEESFQGTGARGTLLFLRGSFKEALTRFDLDLRFLQQLNPGANAAFFGPCGLFHILALLHAPNGGDYHAIAAQIAAAHTLFHNAPESEAYTFLATFVHSRIDTNSDQTQIALPDEDIPHSLTLAFAALCQYWITSTIQPNVEAELITGYARAVESRYFLPAMIYAEILTKLGNAPNPALFDIDGLRTATGMTGLLPLFEPEEPWKRALQALISITSTEEEASSQAKTRLVWMVDTTGTSISITPREQKLSLPGGWGKGRPISLARLHQAKLSYLTPKDRKICAAIKRIHNPDTNSVSYHFNLEKALLAMIGHPLLFLSKSPTTPVEFLAGEPELLIEEKGENLLIRFAQPIGTDSYSIFQETPSRIRIITINDKHREIARQIGMDGLLVPISASDHVLKLIGNSSSFMTVHSAIAGDRAAGKESNIEFIEADSTIYMHLLPYGAGFRLEMFVKPFPAGMHYLKPGQGVENIMTEIQGRRMQTKRDLALEEEKARDVEELCPILDLAIDLEHETDREWHLQDPEDCLQALLELQAIRDKVVIEWPEGEKLSIAYQASFENLNLKVRTNRQNWLAIDGSLRLDQDHVIKLKDLLSTIKSTAGRFVEIGAGQFVTLTQEFRKRLEDLSIYANGFENDELLIHPLAALPLEDLISQTAISTDNGWKRQLEKIRAGRDVHPEVPSTLQAELRDYQKEGFYWLARLAQWGVGGCLADDMGLGKTLQALAIILRFAADGPSLVVAPTSVSTNWLSEVTRFTPTLQIRTLSTKDRNGVIGDLGPFDLVITTYTMLQQEMDLLAAVPWQTIILDEAQAIKNAATKRSKAAMSLQGRFKLITTGTPIENHLGELWNLFHFINPGLLGSVNSFNDRFAIPIERYQDRDARLKLKKLIRPFILRRIKSEVLDELPARTEITLEVEMSEYETHFYEALRQNAIDILENNKDKKKRHLQILTEIMRLRQACCSPRLLDPHSRITSSKLKVFTEIVEELIDSRHKVLVFSQFIGHLRLIREFLDKQKISYQYLDGSTSTRLRKERVEAFQAGEGDLFLISLKAGGLGLNLTAADYVIHMDPWWNPAIEDQASDRAHRIGQTRPVTIYRLVCKNSIEEKIVRLHQEKRDLAGSLLEGSDLSAKMSSEDLLDLIRLA